MTRKRLNISLMRLYSNFACVAIISLSTIAIKAQSPGALPPRAVQSPTGSDRGPVGFPFPGTPHTMISFEDFTAPSPAHCWVSLHGLKIERKRGNLSGFGGGLVVAAGA